jgi:hypothetical protein
MTTKSAEILWKTYPGWRMHCEVNAAGPDSYRIVMSLYNDSDESVGYIEHYGTGNLIALKDEAFQRLINELEQPAK